MITIKGKKNGYSLVEVLIATVLLLITAVSFIDILKQSSDLVEGGRPEDVAIKAIQAQMDTIDNAATLADILTFSGNTFAVAGLTPPANTGNPGLVSVTQVVDAGNNPIANLFRVTVQVNWLQGQRVRQRQATTVLIRR